MAYFPSLLVGNYRRSTRCRYAANIANADNAIAIKKVMPKCCAAVATPPIGPAARVPASKNEVTMHTATPGRIAPPPRHDDDASQSPGDTH